MSVRYFNEDQEDYIEYLATIPLKDKCWCGWYKLGQCPHCPKDVTCADKCLPCGGCGKRWLGKYKESEYTTCPDCGGSGKKAKERDNA